MLPEPHRTYFCLQMQRALHCLKSSLASRPKLFVTSMAMAEARLTSAWLSAPPLSKPADPPGLALPTSIFFRSSSDAGFGSKLRNAAAPLQAIRHPRRKNISMIFEDTTTDAVSTLTGSKKTSNASSVAPVTAANSALVETGKLPTLEKLKGGFVKFKKDYLKDSELVSNLAKGQQPPYMIITCSDSRVDPCTVLSLGLGEAFVVRNIGNMVPPYASSTNLSAASAIEYAVLHLKVKHLVIMGHSCCGAIKALMGIKEDRSNRFSDFIEDWVLVSKDAANKVKRMHPNASLEEQCTHCEKEVVNLSLLNCLSFPFVREKMASGDLTLHGAHYDFVNLEYTTWCLDLSCLHEVDTVQ